VEGDGEFILSVEASDDDTEVSLIVRSGDGRKITMHDFILVIEEYLHDVTNAEAYRIKNNSPTH